jgi:hypothetical protein
LATTKLLPTTNDLISRITSNFTYHSDTFGVQGLA